jgi:multisubunit Na+/H+ antiporter MnhB subunit
MKNISKLLFTLFTVLTAVAVQAQPVEMADTMRSEGKIYVVVGIVLIVLAGLITYLFMLDRRVKKLENGQK